MTAYVYALKGEWRVSLAPEIDRVYWKRRDGTALTEVWQYRSLGWAVRQVRQHAARRRTGRNFTVKRRASEKMPHSAGRLHLTEGGISWHTYEAAWEKWRWLLAGRSLLFHEVVRLLGARDVREEMLSERNVRMVLQAGVLRQEVTLLPSIRMTGGQARWKCERCHAGRDQLLRTECARCGGICYYCDNCLLLGRAQACEPLLQFVSEACHQDERHSAGVNRRRRCADNAVSATHSLPLTPAQQRAAEAAFQFVKRRSEPIMLMWAVTGAGKTEMTFNVIAHVLSCGGRVAVATPRKDVVDELAPRFREAFPQVRVVKLHGDSGETWHEGELVIATTHQLWRWYCAFNLIVVDEVDAFPYRHDATLQAGLRRALTVGGQQLWLTATPPRAWQRAYRRGVLPGVTIPARYHGHPLPEPVLTVVRRLWQHINDSRSIPAMRQFFERVRKEAGQAYVFVPGLAYITPVTNWIERHVDAWTVTGVSSRDRERSQKIVRFRDKAVDCLVTTTILERGVTVPNAHVLILQADHPVFDEAALVQMSGRSGRSAAYPSGQVMWIASQMTREQQRAVTHIQSMNNEAKQHGWLVGATGGEGGWD